ncbi:MAG: iron chelate uptake ABC transporter family permease subunit [Oscillospiraceae bacterium]|jgi:iron complex transport system permease protein|nr:iron chelate uptake ABC transporter family permease subunit [Oscillospiraceae bacterium]
MSSWNHGRRCLVFIACAGLLLICAALSLSLGSRQVTLAEIIGGVTKNAGFTMGELVVHQRIPRTVFGLVAGCALAMSGTLMQAVTRNPLADPGILGVNTGAALAIVVGIAFFGIGSLVQYMAFALLGASVTAVFVYAVGSLGYGGATPVKLALAGTATSAALSSLVSLILLPRSTSMDAFRFWQSGGIGGATFGGIASIAPLIVIGAALGICAVGSLNALALGDDAAAGLGVKTARTRLLGAVAGVLLCGATTALAGPIGFIGLVAPHIVRLIAGPDLRYVLPLSAVAGASVLLLADTAGRVIGSPGEIEAGLVSAFVGAPILVFIAVRSKVRAL